MKNPLRKCFTPLEISRRNASVLTGFTLIELVIGITLMSVIILAVFSFEIVSREIFRSSERKFVVSNEVFFVLDHIQKTVWDGEGDADDPSLVLVPGIDPVLDVKDAMGNLIGRYLFDFSNNEVVFYDGAVDSYLTKRLYNDAGNPFEINLLDGGVRINNLTLIYDPSAAHHYRNNPSVNTKGIYFYPYGQE